MAKVKMLLATTVPCATPNNVRTVDGLPHQMGVIVPAFVLPDGKENDPKAFMRAIDEYLNLATAVSSGETVELTDASGATVTRKDGSPVVLTPSDDIPTKANRVTLAKKVKGIDKNVDVISHGTFFPKTLPSSYKAVAAAINKGMQALVKAHYQPKLVENFKAETGKRGRKSATIKVDDL